MSKPRFYILYHESSPDFYAGDLARHFVRPREQGVRTDQDHLYIESVVADSKNTGHMLEEKITKKVKKLNMSLKEKGMKISLEFRLLRHDDVQRCVRGDTLCLYEYGLGGCEGLKKVDVRKETNIFLSKNVQEYVVKRPIQDTDREKFRCLKNVSGVRLYHGTTLKEMNSDELYLYVNIKAVSLKTVELSDTLFRRTSSRERRVAPAILKKRPHYDIIQMK